MTTSNPREIPFNGVRLRFDSKKRFDELVSALLADVGKKPLMIDDLPAKFESWESYKAEVESHVGPSGFILFALMNHGAWIKKVQIRKQVLRVVSSRPNDSGANGVLPYLVPPPPMTEPRSGRCVAPRP
jgi:hypothetical protein